MFERYSLPSRRAIFFAREAALNAGTPEIDPMHLLLGLMVEKSSCANAVCKVAERFPEDANRMQGMRRATTQGNLPLTLASKRILAYTAEEANRMDDYWIDTDHLVLGILRERDCPAAQRLEAAGLTIEQARTLVANSIPEEHEYPPTAASWWDPRATTSGRLAAATYVLLIVVLLTVVLLLFVLERGR